MNNIRIVTLTGFISAVAALPAMAEWVPVISVPVNQSATVDVIDASGQLPGLVEALSFRANDTDVSCQEVTVFYRNGNQDRLWRGMLPAGHTKTIHMLPVHRDVARIGFHCWSLNKPGAVDIAADVPGNAIMSYYDPKLAQLRN